MCERPGIRGSIVLAAGQLDFISQQMAPQRVGASVTLNANPNIWQHLQTLGPLKRLACLKRPNIGKEPPKLKIGMATIPIYPEAEVPKSQTPKPLTQRPAVKHKRVSQQGAVSQK